MTNSTSNFTALLTEICQEEQITLNPYADEWAWELSRGDVRNYIFGYQFGLNRAVVQSICNDKGMASELLAAHGLPCVMHTCLMPPEKMQFVSREGAWKKATELLQQYGTIVCKDNEGTGGDRVYLVHDQLELEKTACELFARGCAMSICPWVPIKQEYRVIVLDGEVQIVFSKERKGLTGDGFHTVRELYVQYLEQGGAAQQVPTKVLDRVLAEGESYYFEWKHNLGRGAGMRLHQNEPELAPVRELALRTVKLLGARFVSVDVIETAEGYEILEVNSGVMMENLAGMGPESRALAKETYRKAIHKMMEV